jgi:hypothetical protein
MKLTHVIVRVWKEKIRAGGRMTFGTGIAIPFVVLPPASRNWDSAMLSCGGCDCGVMAASSIPQGIRGSNHSHGCLLVSSTDHFPQGKQQADQKHCEKNIVIWADIVRKMLLEFTCEDAGLEALHLHRESEQLKIGLQFSLSELPKQNFFQKIKRLI